MEPTIFFSIIRMNLLFRIEITERSGIKNHGWEVNLCLLGKRIASSKFCLGRTWISITMKFINENEVVNGRATVILFLVCVPKRSNLSSCFEVSRKGRGNR